MTIRSRVFGSIVLLLVAVSNGRAELLSKTSFGDQTAHIERVTLLSRKLRPSFEAGLSGSSMGETRALAATLRAALSDMMMQAGRSEAGAKVAPPLPPSGLSSLSASSALEDTQRAGEGSDGVAASLDSLLLHGTRARDDAAALAISLEQGGVAEGDLRFLIEQIETAVTALGRAAP